MSLIYLKLYVMVSELFVYGTLMQDTDSAMARFLHDRAYSRGMAYLSGRLYDLGSYPGAVYDPAESNTITGQVYSLRDPEAIFPILDEYEGVSPNPSLPEEYVRELVPASLNNEIISCWIYRYNFDITTLPLIPSGNYLTYYAEKLAHRQFIENGR